LLETAVKCLLALSSAIQGLNKVFEEIDIKKLHPSEVQEYAWGDYYLKNLIKLLMCVYT